MQKMPECGQSELLEKIFLHAHDCIVLLDRDFNFIRVNQAYCRVCDRPEEEFAGRNHFELYPSPLIEDCRRVVETAVPFQASGYPFEFPDHPEWGVTYWDLTLVPLLDGYGRVDMLLFTLRDVTKPHRMLNELQETNRALKTISACNSLLIHAVDEKTLLEGMCRVVVDSGGYRMAWIGLAETGGALNPVAHAGNMALFGRDEGGKCCAAEKAIRAGRTQVNPDCCRDPGQPEYGSSIALPLTHGGTEFGVLAIQAFEPDAFGKEQMEILEQLAGDLSYGIANLRSDSARRQAEIGLRASEERYHKLFENGTDAIALADAETGELLDVNHALEKLIGRPKAELIGKSQKMLHPPEPSFHAVSSSFQMHRTSKEGGSIETRILRKDGTTRDVEIRASTMDLEGRKVLLGFFRDLSDRKHYEERLEYQATHDSLTGLPNRKILSDRLAQSVAHSRRAGKWAAAMLMDLDRFKIANDSLGHDAGDEILREMGRRLSNMIRSGDTVARLGGDEFMLIFPELSSEEDTVLLARKYLDAIALPMKVAGREISVSASLGIAIYPRDGEDPSSLLRNADVAMYRAKELGGNGFQFYSSEMNERMLQKLELENGIRRALDRREFELYYQPKVDLRQGHIVGVEALIRWNHPGRGIVSPGEFIPLAEETGLIVQIGEWVIEESCARLAAWKEMGLADTTLAINLSAKQFQQKDLLSIMERSIRKHAVDAALLEIEVTESAAMADPEQAILILQDLKKLGVRISLDDFGTGYSSLSCLKRFPVDSLKIDRSFVNDIAVEPSDASITRMMISMAHSMDRKVIAEGVESEAQLRFLQREGCDEMQGYYFSRPVPESEVTAMLLERRRLPSIGGEEDSPALLLVDDEENVLKALQRVLRRDGYRILATTSAGEALQLMVANQVGVIVADQRMPEMKGVEFLRKAKQLHPDSMRIVLTGYTELKSVTNAVNEGAIYKFHTKPWDDDQLRDNVREAFRLFELKKERDSLLRELALSGR